LCEYNNKTSILCSSDPQQQRRAKNKDVEDLQTDRILIDIHHKS